jgi:glycosyltransferase involved in cell wall biosynthesis
MKIAYLIASYLSSIGGGDVFTHNAVTGLRAKGVEAAVVTASTRRIKKGLFDYPVIHINPVIPRLLFKFPALGKIWLCREIERLQERYGFSLWQIIGGYPFGTYSVDYLRHKKIPAVLRCMGEDIQVVRDIGYGYRLDPAVDRLVREKYPLFDKVVALTDSVSDELEKIVPEDKISVIPNGIKVEKYQRSYDRASIRRTLGVKDDEVLLLTVGRYHPKKGSGHIPGILRRLLEKGYNVKWLLVGIQVHNVMKAGMPDSDKERMILKNADVGLDGKGLLDIPSRELLEFYHASDMLVFPTVIETFGRVLIEAMASGLPVVSTNVEGVKDVVRHYETGMLSERGDEEGVFKNIEKLCNDKALYEKLKANGPDRARDFDWPLVVDKYVDVYEDIIKRKSG